MFCSRLALSLPQVVTFGNGSTFTYYYAADGTKVRTVHVVNGATTQTDYCGNVIYENGAQKLLLTEEGYYDFVNGGYCYYLKDHQGNNRVVINDSGTVKETNHYYPFGGLFANSTIQPFKYNGKEFDSKNGLNWYDYGARHYDATLGRWHVVDPSAENYLPFSPYTYCANNPELFIDLNGRDWFYYKKEGSEEATWNWHDGNKYDTGVKDENGNNVVLTGVESVVVFNGSYDEKLGADQTLDEKQGAKLAEVTVYGPKGENDIQQYKGYTMSSDPNLFGVVDNGIHDVRRLHPGERKGPYKSDWVVNNRGNVPALGGYNPAYPERNPAYLNGIFIHRNNWNGFAGTYINKNGDLKAVSEGCLLIIASQWDRFEKQLNGVSKLKLQIKRK